MEDRMNRIFWILALSILFGASASFCQIDSMGFSEIAHIILPEPITILRVVDLDSDSLKEIILATENYIYEYNSSADSLLWQSPQLPLPQSLLFEDINNDGLKDIAEHDSTGIHFYDPHNLTLIWSSPPFEGTYRLYALGFRNDDNYVDLAIIRSFFINGGGLHPSYDSCITDIYEGPPFDSSGSFYFNMINSTGDYAYDRESIGSMVMANLNGQTGPRRVISISTSHTWASNRPYQSTGGWSGRLLQFDGNSLDTLRLITSGELTYMNYVPNEDDGGTIYSVSTSGDWTSGGPYWTASVDISLKGFDSDGLSHLISLFIWHFGSYPPPYSYINSIFGDLLLERPGYELCYATTDSIYLMAVSNGLKLWTAPEDSILGIYGIFNSPNIYSQAQVVLRITHPYNYYKLLNISDGSVSSIILPGNSNITNNSDLNHDGNDEILYYQGNRLDIYTLQTITSINDDVPTPRSLSLRNYPNPFNPSTSISYNLPASSAVTLSIFDILGRKVETLVSGHQAAGHHEIIWNAGTKPSGVYFAKATTAQGSAIIKMIYLK
jgi:hypothetical protein